MTKESKFFKDYVNVHRQLVTGNNTERKNQKIKDFFTRLKDLPEEYKKEEWGLTTEIPTCENIVADEDLWHSRERSLPLLTDKKIQGVYEIKRELLSHSAVILNSSNPSNAGNAGKKDKKEAPLFPFLSYFKYDETSPLFPEFSAKSPYIELNPSQNFSSAMRRSCLKPLPLEPISDLEHSSSQHSTEPQNGEVPNIFAFVKKDPTHNQHNPSGAFSSALKRDFFNGSAKSNEVKLIGNENESKVVFNSLKPLLTMIHVYWTKKKPDDREHFNEDLHKKRAELSKMLANPTYSLYADTINDGLKIIEKALSYK